MALLKLFLAIVQVAGVIVLVDKVQQVNYFLGTFIAVFAIFAYAAVLVKK